MAAADDDARAGGAARQDCPRVAARLARFPVEESGTGDARVSFRAAGTGTPLVMLHGISGGSGAWLPQLETLADAFRVIAWDAPGYGASTIVRGAAPRAADYADALAAFLDRLGVECCLLVGQSLGAMMGTAFARAHPARVCGLALFGPARGYGDATPERRDEVLRGRLDTMARLGPDGMAATRARALLGTSPTDDAIALVASGMRALHPEGYAQAARLLAGNCLPDDAAYVTAPVLVACGTADTVTPEAGCQAIAAAFARAEYHAIAEAGHASGIDRPDQVNALLRAFAKRIDGAVA